MATSNGDRQQEHMSGSAACQAVGVVAVYWHCPLVINVGIIHPHKGQH